jgi:hypothetical protein
MSEKLMHPRSGFFADSCGTTHGIVEIDSDDIPTFLAAKIGQEGNLIFAGLRVLEVRAEPGIEDGTHVFSFNLPATSLAAAERAKILVNSNSIGSATVWSLTSTSSRKPFQIIGGVCEDTSPAANLEGFNSQASATTGLVECLGSRKAHHLGKDRARDDWPVAFDQLPGDALLVTAMER